MNKMNKSNSLPHTRYLAKTSFFGKQTSSSEIHEQIRDLAIFGNYTINKKYILGKGFCSKVYKAIHNQTKQKYAIKVIQLTQIKSAVQKRFLKNEIKYLKLLKNAKNVLHFYEIINTDTKLAIVTEICKQSIYQKLRSKNGNEKSPLERGEVLKIMKQIVNGYNEMRQHNLIHRDIKPANILINHKGQVKIADLGFCTIDDDIQEDKFINVGSPLYMAPQVLKGNSYSEKADIWAIGLIFLQMMIGDFPWKSCKQEELRNNILKQDIPSLIPKDLAPQFRQMLQKCLQFEPVNRAGIAEMMKCFNKKQQRSIIQIDNLVSKKTRMASRQKKVDIPSTQISCQNQLYPKPNFNSIKQKVLSQFSTRHSLKQLIRQKKNGVFLQNNEGSQNMIKMKLKLGNQNLKIAEQQMNKLHFCRFLFKIVQLIINGSDNINYTYYDFDDEFPQLIARYILTLMEQIKLVKGGRKTEQVKVFKKSGQFIKVMHMVTKYQKNYMQYFQIKFKRQIVERQIEIGYLLQKVAHYVKNASTHLKVIREELFKSDLEILIDQEINQFVHLMHCLTHLKHSLKTINTLNQSIKNNNFQNFLQKISHSHGITLEQFNFICKRVLQ